MTEQELFLPASNHQPALSTLRHPHPAPCTRAHLRLPKRELRACSGGGLLKKTAHYTFKLPPAYRLLLPR